MEKDKALEELFLAQTPHFNDGAEFMQKLTKRLDAVEIVRQYQERNQRRYRVMVAVAFVTGIVSGVVSTWWLLSSPIEVPHIAFQTQTTFLLWLVRNSRILLAAAFPMLMMLAACIVAANILDILDVRRKMREDFV